MLLKFIFTLLFAVTFHFPHAEGAIGYGVLVCWRDHPNTKSTYNSAISLINRYVDGDPKPSGDVLRAVSQAIWPTQDVSPDAPRSTSPSGHPATLPSERALQTIQNNASFFSETFLQVTDIEKGSLYLREFSLLYFGAYAELINFHKSADNRDETHQWENKQKLENVCYVMAKYSYWFLRYMPKKMADNIVFDSQKFGNNQLGLVNQINAKRLSEYDEPLAKCSANDNNACSDYTMGFLKSVRITNRRQWEEFWKDILQDFRQLLFRRHCRLDACLNDRYEELYIHIGEPISLQFQASNAENGQFCGSNVCTAMWLSTGGHTDHVYYRPCLGDNPVELTCKHKHCSTDQWTVCTKGSDCTLSTVLTNDHFPLALRSGATGTCIDCSDTVTWCKLATCPSYVHNSTPTLESSEELQCSESPEHCKGPQFQIHNFERGQNEPLEILDEVHFSYASKAGSPPKFLSGDLYSGAFLRTQYYMRLKGKFSVVAGKTGLRNGPYSCPIGKTWGMMSGDERALCAQSSFTLFKKIEPRNIIASHNTGHDASDTCSSVASNNRIRFLRVLLAIFLVFGKIARWLS
ncbi:hypothetical protein BV898_04803 [Hypsibius exemplaris]|uniref:Uncharacterized protein n=1 Tax=Hypsibius exemplaris TaxID=2072580 RepID=A0A1W0X1F8_HYPEX|nr:hypothetical protein BV898_04803 [Hypsibius exemplaris]